MRDYYGEIDRALKKYEECKPWKDHNMDWICCRIDWCWKFRKITEKEMEELADRAVKVMDSGLDIDHRW